MDFISILGKSGVGSEKWALALNLTIQVVIVVAAGLLAVAVAKWVLGPVVAKIAKRTPFKWDDLLFDRKLFSALGWLLAPIIIRLMLPLTALKSMALIHNLIAAWICIASVVLVAALLRSVNRVYETFPGSRERPIKIFIQLVIIFLWCAAVMIIISIFTKTSIAVLLGGLTAFAAVLILVFQDSILGFVAGIELNSNDMVRVGDWIEMPARGVDGDVMEINLNTVKVRNWDMTIVTVPTHKLVQESFVNWRGMSESGGRRIKRAVSIDVDSIHYLDEAEIDRLIDSALLSGYMTRKMTEIKAFNASRESPIDKRHLTNIGTFREYLEQLLAKNPDIRQDMTHMVRQLAPGPTGLPLEIYCFSARQNWVEYEGVQADIFDHIFAVMGLFGLRAYQYATDNCPAIAPPLTGKQ